MNMPHVLLNHYILFFTLWLVLSHCRVADTSDFVDHGHGSEQDENGRTTLAESDVAIDDNWILNSTAETLDELIQEGPPLDAGSIGRARAIGREEGTTPPPRGPGGGAAGRDGDGDAAPERRPEHFWTVTVPWTGGMLLFLFVFLYAMRTDGCVYRRLTQSYTPPAARQQLAEEERRERLEETERTATTAWESERARWRSQRSQSQRSPHPDNSTTVSSSSSEPAPSVSWAQPTDEHPTTRRTRAPVKDRDRVKSY